MGAALHRALAEGAGADGGRQRRAAHSGNAAGWGHQPGRSYFTRILRLSYLAPDIAQAILDGRQPRDLTADKLLAHSRLPLAWPEQRTALGFA